jgi:hypothetical protein
MGFNRRKMADQRRQAAEKEVATRRATDAQMLEDASAEIDNHIRFGQRCRVFPESAAPRPRRLSLPRLSLPLPRLRSHPHRDLAVLAEPGLGAGEPRLGEFENRNRLARGPVPQLRGDRRNAQHADVGVVRSPPPQVIGAFPDFGRLGMIAAYCRLRRNRKIGFGVRIDEHEADRAIARDLVFLGAAQIGHEPDDPVVAIGPRLQGTRPHPHGGS